MNTNLLLSPVFARPWRTLLKSLSTCCISLSLLSSNLYAAVEINSCPNINSCNYGNVLVGAARIDFGGIRWIGDTVDLLELHIPSPSNAFGFTGCSFYSSGVECQNSAWVSTTPQAILISKPNNGDNINVYFAPPVASVASNDVVGDLWYSTIGPSSEKDLIIKGEGIPDNNSIITLDTTVNVQDIDRTDNSKQEQVVVVPLYGKVRFTVTPQVCSEGACKSAYDKLLVGGLQPIQYVYVNLTVTEQNTGCLGRSSISFQDQGSRENDFAQGGSYYHYLRGPVFTECGGVAQDRSYAFLVSVGKQFYFDAINGHDIGTGHVDYVFYVNGHYDPANPDESMYKGSWKKFQLTNKAQLTVNKTGEGIISATGSNCNLTATECKGAYYARVQVVLTATPATGFKFVNWSGDCNGTDSPTHRDNGQQ